MLLLQAPVAPCDCIKNRVGLHKVACGPHFDPRPHMEKLPWEPRGGVPGHLPSGDPWAGWEMLLEWPEAIWERFGDEVTSKWLVGWVGKASRHRKNLCSGLGTFPPFTATAPAH